MFQDLRFAIRMLGKNPGFTLVAVLTLALGIGANIAIFSVANGVLLRSLPYEEAERLVHPVSAQAARGIDRASIAYADFLDWRDRSGLFERIALYQRQAATITDGSEPERLPSLAVSDGYFELMKVKPLLGRTFLAEDHRPDAERVVIISRGLWQRRYGGASDVIGKTVRLAGTPFTIIGVVSQESVWPDEIELWGALRFEPTPSADMTRRDNFVWQAIARLKEGVTLEQANAKMALMARQIEQEFPASRRGWSTGALPLHDYIIGPQLRLTIWILMGAVVFMLLIACANVANLLLARAASREREIAIRAALGAGRSRIIRQLLTESLLLAALGSSLGLLLGWFGVKGLIAAAPDRVPRLETISIDGRVLVFTLAMTFATALIFGLLPALNISGSNQNDALKEGGRGTTGGRGARRISSALVALEIAVSIVLLIGAGLMSRSFIHLQNVDPGIDVNNLLTFGLSLPRSNYPDPGKSADFYRRLEEKLKVIPGVESAAATSKLPIGGPGFGLGRVFLREGQPEPPASSDFMALWTVVTPDYFKTMRIPLIKGRLFNEQDKQNGNPVIIISRNMARRMFPDSDPIGKRIRSWRDENLLREIIGVVGEVRYRDLQDNERALIYVPHEQLGWRDMIVTLRTNADPLSYAKTVRDEVRGLDKDLAVSNLATMASIRDRSLAGARFNAMLLVIFAAVALILSAVGIYGVMAYSVTQRSHEIGIRMALGADRSNILRLVLSRGLKLTLIGVAIGLIGAAAATRALSSLLYGVSVSDPITFAGIALLLAAVALIACYIPARRATRLDPLAALRHE